MKYPDGFTSQERSQFDFLNENNRVTCAVEPEAMRHLPIVTSGDRRTGRERFRVLLGTAKIKGPRSAHILIKGVLEAGEEELYGLYSEGVEEVTFDPTALRKYTRSIQKTPEYKELHYLGYIHTHPSGIAYPSQQDLESAVHEYKKGITSANEPLIFGIAGFTKKNEPEHYIYRIVRVGDGYGFKRLD